MKESKTTRNSPRRILEIVEAVCQNPQAATAIGLSNKLDIPAPTIYRWLDTLCEERYLAAHSSGHYVPGERFRDMVLDSLQYEPKVTDRRSILRALSDSLGETVSLSIPHGTKLIYFDRLESHWPFQSKIKVGSELPLHCCASGKLYLSTLETADAMAIFNRIEKKRSARNTIVKLTDFKEEITKIREQNYSLDHEEWFDDMNGAAVPIFSEKGYLMASLSTHALATRKSIPTLKKEISLMVDAAKELKSCLRQ